MSLFPNADLNNYDENDKSVLKRMETFYNANINNNQLTWSQSDIDARFEAGDASIFEEMYSP
jgi:hypothetical protein